jgi:Tol biopolymer transport system component
MIFFKMRLAKFSSLTLLTLLILGLIFNFFFSRQSLSKTSVGKARTIAFTAQQGNGKTLRDSLFTIKTDSLARRDLTPSLTELYSTLVWSPNGHRLAFVSEDTDIYVVNVDGSKLTQLFSGNPCKASDFKIAWLPNSQKIVFTRSCDGSTSDTPGSESLYASDTTGTQGTKLIHTWQAGGVPPKTDISSSLYLSPDGKQVAFVKDQDIYKMNTDGSGLTKLTKNSGDYTFAGSRLNWSPDSTRIAFWLGKYPMQQIYQINSDGKNLKNLTKNPDNQVYNSSLLWSPDSTHIAYYYDKPGDRGGKQQDIYLLDTSQGTSQNLTHKSGKYDVFSWSPDGKQIAFISGDFFNQKFYTIDIKGSKLTDLTPQLLLSGVYDLAWSPDSQQIAFTSNEKKGGKSNLYVVNRDGSGLTKLTNDQDLSAYSPAWQP